MGGQFPPRPPLNSSGAGRSFRSSTRSRRRGPRRNLLLGRVASSSRVLVRVESPHRGFRWWYENGRPTDDPRLRLVEQLWGADGQLDWFAAWLWSVPDLEGIRQLEELGGKPFDRTRLPVDPDWTARIARASAQSGRAVTRPRRRLGSSPPLGALWRSLGRVRRLKRFAALVNDRSSGRSCRRLDGRLVSTVGVGRSPGPRNSIVASRGGRQARGLPRHVPSVDGIRTLVRWQAQPP